MVPALQSPMDPLAERERVKEGERKITSKVPSLPSPLNPLAASLYGEKHRQRQKE